MGRPRFVAVGVGQHAGAVDTEFRQFGHAQVDRQLNHLTIEILKLFLMAAAELADRRVIDGYSRGEPQMKSTEWMRLYPIFRLLRMRRFMANSRSLASTLG